MTFLSNLGDQLSSQFSLGENTTHTLDAVVDGQNQKYGALGDFARKFDQSAERRYVEEGYLRRDPYNTDPKQFEILMQEPNATVLVKKRMFSSIAENFRPDFMNDDEKLYYKTIKVLFQNKCRQVAALEKLSKIQKVSAAVGQIDYQLLPVLISLSDTITDGFDSGSDLFGTLGGSNPFEKNISSFTKIIDRLRKIAGFNTTNLNTTWITDSSQLFKSQFGEGSGVIEVTNFTNLGTNVNVDSIKNPGNFRLTISDPYEAMVITEYDIERAIADATNMFYNRKVFQFGKENINTTINNILGTLNRLRAVRKVSNITVKVNPDTLLSKRVIAILDRNGTEIQFTYDAALGLGVLGAGNGVQVAEEYLIGGAALGNEGLNNKSSFIHSKSIFGNRQSNESELMLFQRLIVAIFSKIQLEANSQNAFQLNNAKTNYTRRKMRFNFAGQLIIQPMDPIHIYMSSKSRFDTKLLAGLENMFSGGGILQNLNNTVTDLKASATNAFTAFQPSGNLNFQVEKSVYLGVGPQFPNFLWSMLRSQFITEKEGTHVFGGVVTSANDSWVNGKFAIEVAGSDNTYYFDQGKVNFKPGVDNFNGKMFDPLTPFKGNSDELFGSSADKIPELLDENKYLLGTEQGQSLVKHKAGPFAGRLVNNSNFIQDRNVDLTSGRISRLFYAPDGLVYKWKEGIGVFVQYGDSLDLNDPDRVGTPSPTTNPFAGQDIMNVISLLITGKPYNFATYWQAAVDIGGATRDPHSQQDGAQTYILSLQNSLVKRNSLWGNFIPFKNLTMNEQAVVDSINGLFSYNKKKQELESKIQKLETLTRKSIATNSLALLNQQLGKTANDVNIDAATNGLARDIESDLNALKEEEKAYFTNFGNQASFDVGKFTDTDNASKTASSPDFRSILRRKMNQLTRRMSYDVRGNDDKNLFIVDDSYDQDYDMLAFEQAFENMSLYNGEFLSVRDKISNVAELLNLEVFCDTQGHIRVRQPQYNRMPSSVFYRMMQLKRTLNIQIFPQFLDDLFGTQINTLSKRLEIIEDEIRLDCAILGNQSDQSAKGFILADVADVGPFDFISNEFGKISDFKKVIKSATITDVDDTINNTFGNLAQQAKSSKDLFPESKRYNIIVKGLSDQLKNKSSGFSEVEQIEQNSYVSNLIQRIEDNSGQTINLIDYMIVTDNGNKDVSLPVGKSLDIFKITKQLRDKLNERQKIVQLLYNSMKNSIEYKSLDDRPDDTTNKLLMPSLFKSSEIPESLAHMIEDETYDDYGPNSGSRYVIKKSQIRRVDIGINPPDYTMVQVNGSLSPTTVNTQGLNSFPNNGTGLTTAVAVDYDMWRNYGFKNQQTITVPFLRDPNTQCAPYAATILSRARKNILRGNVTISGNEFMQPGEVVFLEHRGLLFYVTSVQHNFSFVGDFTTTLSLTYGHTPGEYIPNTLDIIGKLLYNNRDVANIAIDRQSNGSGDIDLGILQTGVLPTSQNFGGIFDNDKNANNSLLTFNAKVIQSIIYTTANLLHANDSSGNNVKATIEFRIYYDDSNPLNSDLQGFAQSIVDLLNSKSSKLQDSLGINKDIKIELPKGAEAKVVAINLNNAETHKSPSQKAWDAARNHISTSSTSNSVTTVGNDTDTADASPQVKDQRNKLRTSLFSYIVDCWMVKVEKIS